MSDAGLLLWARCIADRLHGDGISGVSLLGPRSRYDLVPDLPDNHESRLLEQPGISRDMVLVLNRRNPRRNVIVDLFTGRSHCDTWVFLPAGWSIPIYDFCQTGPFLLIGFEVDGDLQPGDSLNCNDLLVIDAWTRTQVVLSMGRSYFPFLL